jgi:lipopolysaccharide biosynthesis regulator YciM
MPKNPNKLDPFEAQLTRWLTKPVHGGEGLSFAAASERLAELGLHTKTGKPLSKGQIQAWWAPRAKEMEGRRALSEYLIEAREQAESASRAPGMSGMLFLQAGLVQIGALVMKLTEAGQTDPATVEGIKSLFASLVAGVREQRSAEGLDFAREKYRESLRTKIEAGIAEIFAEIKGDAEAEALVERLRARVSKATSDAP